MLSAVGLHTFVDPRVDGGRLTPRTAASQLEPRVELVRMGGADCLFYPSLPLDVALLRATTADAHGNLSTENEPFHHDLLSMAQAARNSGGRVVAQVKRIVPYGTLRPCDVKVIVDLSSKRDKSKRNTRTQKGLIRGFVLGFGIKCSVFTYACVGFFISNLGLR